jgi:organic hydroperoxide reductase OsmC/OhrA
MSAPAGEFSIRIEQIDGFEFRVRFDREQFEPLRMDEPPPLGHDRAPNPARVLAAAIGNCLSASLLFCLKRAHVDLKGLTSDVKVELVRNENRRLRVGRVDVRLHPVVDAGTPAFDECLRTFEDFCVVTQSVREGLDVHVSVEPTLPTPR